MSSTGQSGRKAIALRPSTLSAVNDALSLAYANLLPIAEDEQAEKRRGPGRKTCAAIEKAQHALIKDTRP